MQYKVHYLYMVLYGIDVFADEWVDIIGECWHSKRSNAAINYEIGQL